MESGSTVVLPVEGVISRQIAERLQMRLDRVDIIFSYTIENNFETGIALITIVPNTINFRHQRNVSDDVQLNCRIKKEVGDALKSALGIKLRALS